LADFSVLAGTFNKTAGSPGYAPGADFNHDGVVNLPDFSLLASNFNQTGADYPDNYPAYDTGTSCEGAQFADDNGLIIIEIESAPASDGWTPKTDIADYTGSRYYQWTGPNSLGNPGNGLLEYKIKINTPGTYRFQWRSYIAVGTSSSEHNDSWLRFPDADDFYGQKGSSIVYPDGSGKTPNPRGASKDGWFKIYMNQRNQWSWRANTSDHDAHNIYVKFDRPGVYTLQVSGRSTGHAIDRMVMYQESIDTSTATNPDLPETRCVE
jgi:hypothetical protein